MTNELEIITDCNGCGSCCLEMCSPPFLGPTDEEYLALPDAVQCSYDLGMAQREEDGWIDGVACFWFDKESRRCKHYEHRPEICRDFDRGCEACHGWREQYPLLEALR